MERTGGEARTTNMPTDQLRPETLATPHTPSSSVDPGLCPAQADRGARLRPGATLQGKHVLLRGLDNARGEWQLLAACHNLRKLHGQLGTAGWGRLRSAIWEPL